MKPGFDNMPVNYVSFYDSLRFSNWLNNGQGSASTETGAYTLLGGTVIPSNGLTVTRNGGANIVLPSENEWYKAAYYSPGGVYFAYPAGTDIMPVCSAPTATPNRANCDVYETGGWVTDVGAYTGSASPYGTFDQGGNVWEWNEEIVFGSARGTRGGSWERLRRQRPRRVGPDDHRLPVRRGRHPRFSCRESRPRARNDFPRDDRSRRTCAAAQAPREGPLTSGCWALVRGRAAQAAWE